MEGTGRIAPDAAAAARADPLPPLFRWPGGKRWLVDQLVPLLPTALGRYHEPFFGGGALFFALRPETASIADRNAELMDCYRAIRDTPADVARHLTALPQDADSYYRIRADTPRHPAQRAARLIYLTTLAFNGIHRVNKRGEFNVPYSGRTSALLTDPRTLEPYAAALAGVRIDAYDFEQALDSAKPGDTVYLDPPYTVAHSNNGFVKYNDRIFLWRDQQRLAGVANELDRRGCFVFVSNAHHASVRDLYSRFRSIEVRRHSVMAADSGRRGPIQEYVFTNVG